MENKRSSNNRRDFADKRFPKKSSESRCEPESCEGLKDVIFNWSDHLVAYAESLYNHNSFNEVPVPKWFHNGNVYPTFKCNKGTVTMHCVHMHREEIARMYEDMDWAHSVIEQSLYRFGLAQNKAIGSLKKQLADMKDEVAKLKAQLETAQPAPVKSASAPSYASTLIKSNVFDAATQSPAAPTAPAAPIATVATAAAVLSAPVSPSTPTLTAIQVIPPMPVQLSNVLGTPEGKLLFEECSEINRNPHVCSACEYNAKGVLMRCTNAVLSHAFLCDAHKAHLRVEGIATVLKYSNKSRVDFKVEHAKNLQTSFSSVLGPAATKVLNAQLMAASPSTPPSTPPKPTIPRLNLSGDSATTPKPAAKETSTASTTNADQGPTESDVEKQLNEQPLKGSWADMVVTPRDDESDCDNDQKRDTEKSDNTGKAAKVDKTSKEKHKKIKK